MLQNDKDAIRGAIGRYFEGLKTADVALLKSAFHEHANFFGDFGPDLCEAPIQGLFDWASSELQPGQTGPDHRMEIDDIRVFGSVAIAQCRELGFMGGDCDEVFMLVKSAGGWLITNKSWADA